MNWFYVCRSLFAEFVCSSSRMTFSYVFFWGVNRLLVRKVLYLPSKIKEVVLFARVVHSYLRFTFFFLSFRKRLVQHCGLHPILSYVRLPYTRFRDKKVSSISFIGFWTYWNRVKNQTLPYSQRSAWMFSTADYYILIGQYIMSIFDFIFGKKKGTFSNQQPVQGRCSTLPVSSNPLNNSRAASSCLEPFTFKSNQHQRYENGFPVLGVQECLRTLSVEKNINGCSGYQLKNGGRLYRSYD